MYGAVASIDEAETATIRPFQIWSISAISFLVVSISLYSSIKERYFGSLPACHAETIQRLWRKNPTAQFGVTKFNQDCSDVGLKNFTLNAKYVKETSLAETFHENVHFLTKQLLGFEKEVPDEFDWREVGGLTPVKDQGQLGSCYTQAAAACVETAHWMKHNALHRISTQHTIDCFHPECGVNGKCCFENDCNYFGRNGTDSPWVPGGLPSDVYRFWSHHGYVEARQYPYLWAICANFKTKQKCLAFDLCVWNESQVCVDIQSSICLHPTSDMALGKVKRAFWVSINSKDRDTKKLRAVPNEKRMKAAIYQLGPLSVLVDASAMIHYQGGILDIGDEECSKTTMNHVVQVVGFATSSEGIDYWLVRNSWGADFGEEGYLRVKRGSNVCGIANFATAVEVV